MILDYVLAAGSGFVVGWMAHEGWCKLRAYFAEKPATPDTARVEPRPAVVPPPVAAPMTPVAVPAASAVVPKPPPVSPPAVPPVTPKLASAAAPTTHEPPLPRGMRKKGGTP